MTAADDPCPIVGVTGITPIRPVSVRKWESGWVVIDHGGAQVVTLRLANGHVSRPLAVRPVCCHAYAQAAADVLACHYRGDPLPAWAHTPGHPPGSGGCRDQKAETR